MSFEVACPTCSGRLLVSEPGQIVACPHCGAHLQVPQPAPPTAPAAAPVPAAAENKPSANPSPPAAAPRPADDNPFAGWNPDGDDAPAVTPPPAATAAPEQPETTPPEAAPAETAATSEPATAPPVAEATSPANDNPFAGWNPDGDEAPVATPPPAANASQEQPGTTPPEAAPAESAATSEPAPAPPVAQATRPADDNPFAGWNPDGDDAPAVTPPPAATAAPEQPETIPPAAAPAETAATSEPAPAPPVAQATSPAEDNPFAGWNPDGDAAPATTPAAAVPQPASAADNSFAVAVAAVPAVAPAAATPEAAETTATEGEAGTAEPANSGGNGTGSHGTTEPTAASQPKSSRRKDTVSRTVFIAVASYASAVTIALIMSLLSQGAASTHQLESLPDVVPKTDAEGNVLYQLVPEDAVLPTGHELRLGETQRFGNLEVTVVKVTRSPLEFTHYSGSGQTHPPTEPVLKLWLKLRNVSEDQSFMPLGRTLVFKRGAVQSGSLLERSNNFLYPADQQPKAGKVVLLYDHVVNGDWDLTGQDIDRVLKPGESMTTFLPASEEGNSLTGEIVWRVHIRKGYHPESHNGVTTLVDVRFDRSRVQG